MATISVNEITITKPSIDTISFTAKWTPIDDNTLNSQMLNTYIDEKNPKYGMYHYKVTSYNIRANLNNEVFLEGTKIDKTSTYKSSNLKYKLITPENEVISYPLEIFVSLNADIYMGIWDNGLRSWYAGGTEYWYQPPYSPPADDSDTIGATKKDVYDVQYGLPIPVYNDKGAIIGYNRKYTVYRTRYKVMQSIDPVDRDNHIWEGSKSITFYPHQVNFSFNNCQLKADGTHQQWLIEKGINSLITNITDFQKYAWQWKSWKEQKKASSPGGWVDSKNRIGAIQVNALYDYVGITTSDTHKFSSGDKVTMKLFNDLASKINS